MSRPPTTETKDMPRHPKPSELSLQQTQNGGSGSNGAHTSQQSSPMNLQGVDLGSFGGDFQHDVASGLTPLPQEKPTYPQPQSPPGSPRQHNRDTSFLSSFKSKKSSPKEDQKKDTRQGKNDKDDYRPNTGSMSKIYHLRNNPGSTPELSLLGSNENIQKQSSESETPALPSRPQPTPKQSEDGTNSKQKRSNNVIPRFGRKQSIRRDSSSKPRPSFANGVQNGDSKAQSKDSLDAGPKTAPLHSDWPGSEARMKGKEKDRRGASAERAPAPAAESDDNLSRSVPKDSKGKGGGFMGRVGKMMGKGARHILDRTPSNDGKIPDSEYVIKVINLPLVEQTRATRISKDLASCRDKTEYWMPALPWRCIDFLNTNCEEEGLYRIPGSGPQVKHWQRRFDEKGDIDLLDEEVGDTNEIASMLKAWFRELPTEVMPQHLQKELATALEKENPNYKNVGQEAPQLLRDTLSELSPFNYYLLFAITCHLSLLLTNKDRNKMDLNNLAVCVGPCLNLDRWLFNYLVGDWRHCWQGCFTEKEYLNIEKMVEEGHDPERLQQKNAGDEQSLDNNSVWSSTIDDRSMQDERALSSGSSNKPVSSYEARSISHGNLNSLHDRKNENKLPQTYKPIGGQGYSNGSVGLGIEQEIQRPSTAQGAGPPNNMTGMNGGVMDQSGPTNKSRSNSHTPKIGTGHNRSRSDVPVTPIKINADYGYPVRPPSRSASRQSARRG
ncbi:hypothetical protein AC579_7715 [Pseudocercospora musae]|uniref:Rho-GAP domain-containing protein n=1 Tax=Pseudocercospora musae TaxID=113226 RepID=A0A139IUG3_9PEZI|nr:hypothetical protein AC579_7715 [Pseudocercospora musae]KXT18186.1 hypothetical protein AC579_7715 [Pseudocercospora musae]